MNASHSSSYLLDYFQRGGLISSQPQTGPQLCGAQVMHGVVSQLNSEYGFSAQVLGRLNNRGLVSVTKKVGDCTSRRHVGDTGWQEALEARNRSMLHLSVVCPTPLFGSRDTDDILMCTS